MASSSSSFRIEIKRSAAKEIAALPKQYLKAVTTAISKLAKNPRPVGSIKMSGIDAYRIRVGVYRIVYSIDDGILTVTIVSVGHRKDVYR